MPFRSAKPCFCKLAIKFLGPNPDGCVKSNNVPKFLRPPPTDCNPSARALLENMALPLANKLGSNTLATLPKASLAALPATACKLRVILDVPLVMTS